MGSLLDYVEQRDGALKPIASGSSIGVEDLQEPSGQKGIGGVATGAGKGIISTLTGISSLGERFLSGILPGKQLSEREGSTGAENIVPEELRTPEGAAEKIGFGIEQMGEFFLPTSALNKGVKAAEAAAKAAGLTGKSLSAARIGARAALEGASATGILSAQDGNVTSEAVKAGAITAGLSGALSGLASVLPKAAKNIQKVSLRLTPANQRDLGTKIDDVVDFLNREKISGTPKARTSKVASMLDDAEDVISDVLNSDIGKRTINKSELLDDISRLRDNYVNDRDFAAINRQLDSLIDQMNAQFADDIEVAALNEFKRSTQKGAFNKAGEKILDDIEFAVSNKVYDAISDAIPEATFAGKTLREFNKEYSTLITAKKLLEAAESRRQAGPMLRLISGLAAGTATAMSGPGVLASPLAAVGASTGVEELAKYRNVLAPILKSLSPEDLQKFVRSLPFIVNELLVEIDGEQAQ